MFLSRCSFVIVSVVVTWVCFVPHAFDFERWEPWASSGDAGWGAWSVEAGWGQAWTAAVLGMRLENTSFWEMTSSTRIREKWNSVQKDIAKNQGGPWKGDVKP